MSDTTTLPYEQEGATLVISPTGNLSEFAFDRIQADADQALQLLDGDQIKNLVMDFKKTDYFASTALGVFVKFWKRVCEVNGKMAFCNLSDHEREILGVTKLDTLWSICPTRADAMQTVTQ